MMATEGYRFQALPGEQDDESLLPPPRIKDDAFLPLYHDGSLHPRVLAQHHPVDLRPLQLGHPYD